MNEPRGTGDGGSEESRPGRAPDPDALRQAGRASNAVHDLVALSLLLLASHTVDDVLQVLAVSVEGVTGCALVLVRFRRADDWITWPPTAGKPSRREPSSLPSVARHGDTWSCMSAVPGLPGPSGRLLVASSTRPTSEQLFLVERLGQILGAALANAELCERDRRRTVELEAAHAEQAAAVASLRHRDAVQRSFSHIAVTGRAEDVADSLSQLTGRTVVVRDAFGHETTRISAGQGSRRPHPAEVPDPTSSPVPGGDSPLVSAIGGDQMSFGTIALDDAAGPGAPDPDARFALQYASTALGLLMAHEQAMGEVENRLSRDLVEDILDEVAPGSAVARAAAQGHDLRTAHDVVVVVWPLPHPPGDHADRDVEHVRTALRRQRMPFLLTRRQGAVVIMAHQGVDLRKLYDDLSDVLGYPTVLVAMGEPALTPHEAPRAYEQARRALAARQSSGEPWGHIAYTDLGVDRILAVEGNAGEVERLITQWLDELIQYDRAHGADLVLTLATYLDRGGKYDETAQALSIHRNTLRYRLSRIAEISGHDLADTETRLNLHLATRAWRLRARPAAPLP